MLLPKRVKYRRQHRGRMKGAAHKGNYVSYGDFGLQALEPSWITSNPVSYTHLDVYKRQGTSCAVAAVYRKEEAS